MERDGTLAPAVESILASARDRGGGSERVSVEARCLSAAIAAAERDGRTPVIAEVKPTSPTAEGTRRADPASLATAMVRGGACAISVLTEPEHFGGTPADLAAVREAVQVPVLRKDFVVRGAQLDAVAADVVLLIARFVEDDLDRLLASARERGFQVLVEAHTPGEVDAAVEAGAGLVGINNRDLAALEVDLGTFERVGPTVPEGVTLLAESGIGTPADARRMRRAGADALLVGSAIMDYGDGAAGTTGDDRAADVADVERNTRRLATAEDTNE